VNATASFIADMVRPEDRVWLAGLPVDVIRQTEIIALLEAAVMNARPTVLANLNLHGLYAALTTPVMGDLLRNPETIVHIDGTPIMWMARLLGQSVPPDARAGHIDLIPKMLRRCAERGWPVAIVGGRPEDASMNKRALASLAPGLHVASFHGYFDMADTRPGAPQVSTVEAIKALRPALLLVGMGMPRQEAWIAAHHQTLGVPVVMPVGGFADYFAGRTRTAPRVLGPLGLEWLFRLIHDPRRLAFRYLVEPFLLAGLLVRATAQGARWGRHAGSVKK